MPQARFEPKIAASEMPYTNTLDRAATGTGINLYSVTLKMIQKDAFFKIPAHSLTTA
jgi:hypothetical protein